jgi:uncharacterized protein
MPTNLPVECGVLDKEYRDAKNVEDKIDALKRLIAAIPKHKGCEHLVADLKRKLSKLEEQKEKRSKKSGARKDVIRKTGDIMISILGLTQSGKSSLLKSLTNSSVEISHIPYTTKKPTTGVTFFEGVDIQFVEIPAFFLKNHMNIAHGSDMLLLISKNQEDVEKLEEILKDNRLDNKKKIVLNGIDSEKDKLLNDIIKTTGIIRVFLKPVGKPTERKAFVMKKESSVKNLIERINEDWLKIFRFVRIFDNSKFSGRQVGLDYLLKDKDIVEIHML